jgi:hypothetical protein
MQLFFGVTEVQNLTKKSKYFSRWSSSDLALRFVALGAVLVISGCGGASDSSPSALSAEPESSPALSPTHAVALARRPIPKPAPTPVPAPTPAPTSGPNAIPLPIEVFGPAGASKSVSFNLQSISGLTSIYVRCHACGYDDKTLDADPGKTKASLRINGGPPIALKHYTGDGGVHGNAAIQVMQPEKNYGGIGGGFRTVRFTLPATGLKVGSNTLSFQHTNPDTRSIGFRIIDLTVRQGAIDVIPTSQRALVNASRWQAALPAADIAQGRTLWSQRDALYDPHVDALDGQMNGGRINGQIKASCADCHARDGRDLHYFRFSDESIYERAKFHRLSETQGKQIAAYIRSLTSVPAPEGAWPWNPPYQPGPGLDSKPVSAWAAGAGLDAVLEKDADMKPYLFPGGRTDPAAVSAVVDRFSTLNLRELPIALQLPDWNTWLPRVHPLDAFKNTVLAVRTDEKGQQVYPKAYFEVLYDNARNAPSSAALDTMMQRTRQWFGRGATCYTQSVNNGPDFRAANGTILSTGLAFAGAPSFDGQDCMSYRHDESRLWAVEAAKAGLGAWASVKQWEIAHTNNLEEDSKLIGTNVCAGGRCVNASEVRGWGTSDQNVFHRAAHFLGFDSRRFRDQDPLVSTYGNTAWYYLQLVLNPGYRHSQPVHFAYMQPWIVGLDQESNESQSFRFWATQIKMRQLQTNGEYGKEIGHDLRTSQPMMLYSGFDGDSSTRRGVGPELWKNLVNAQLRDFLGDVVHATAADWAAAKNNSVVQSPSSNDLTPCVAPACKKPFQLGPLQGRNTFRAIDKLRLEAGADPALLNRLADWGASMWPLGHWQSLKR